MYLIFFLTKRLSPLVSWSLLIFTFSNLLALDWSESKVLKSHTQVRVKNENKIIVRTHDDIIIARKSDVHLGYDGLRETDFIELSKIEAVILDSKGKVLKKLKKDDIQESSISYYSVYDKHINKQHRLTYPYLPYPIKKFKEYELKSTFFLPRWYPQEDVVVDYAKFEIILETPVDFIYKNIGNINEPEIFVNDDGHKHYRWTVENIPAYQSEYKSAPEARLQVGVKCMPVEFELDGFQGNANSWDNFDPGIII